MNTSKTGIDQKQWIVIYNGNCINTYYHSEKTNTSKDISEYVVLGFPYGNSMNEAEQHLITHLLLYNYTENQIDELLSDAWYYPIS